MNRIMQITCNINDILNRLGFLCIYNKITNICDHTNINRSYKHSKYGSEIDIYNYNSLYYIMYSESTIVKSTIRFEITESDSDIKNKISQMLNSTDFINVMRDNKLNYLKEKMDDTL